MIFKLFGDQKGRFSHNLRTNSHMALFNESDRLFHGLCKLESTEEYGQTSSTEGGDRHFLGGLDILSGVDDSHIVEFL